MDRRLLRETLNGLKTTGQSHTFVTLNRVCGQYPLPQLEGIAERVKSPSPSTQDPAYERGLRESLAAILTAPSAPVLPLLDRHRVAHTLSKPLGTLSPMYDRMGMELAIGLNAWLAEYRVELTL